MSKLKIEKGASKVRRAPLKATIDGTVADDIELMCEWSENDTSYVVNQLLSFALNQSDDFQQYKQSLENGSATITGRNQSRPQTAKSRTIALTARSPEAEQ